MNEGYILVDSTCNEAIDRLADWIVKAHQGETTRLASMVESFEARTVAADDLIGRYYGVIPEFTALCDKLADGTDVRRSMVRDSLRCVKERLVSSRSKRIKPPSTSNVAGTVAA